MSKSIYDLLKGLDVTEVKTFESRNIEHPDGKVSKKTGKVLKVTQFKTGKNGKWIDASDTYSLTFRSREHAALKLDTPAQYRWLKADVTPEIESACNAIRGKLAMTELLLDTLDFKVKCSRKVANAQVVMSLEDITNLQDILAGHIQVALNTLKGNKVKESINVAF